MVKIINIQVGIYRDVASQNVSSIWKLDCLLKSLASKKESINIYITGIL